MQGTRLFKYFYHTDIDHINFKVKICRLEAQLQEEDEVARIRRGEVVCPSRESQFSMLNEAVVEVALWANGQLIGMPLRTRGTPTLSHDHDSDANGPGRLVTCEWSEWVTFPLRVSALPVSARVVITVWALAGPGDHVPVGGTTVPVFGHNGIMQRGVQRLGVWHGREGDPCDTTPGLTHPQTVISDTHRRMEMSLARYERGDVPRVPWLDRVSVAKAAQIKTQEIRKHLASAPPPAAPAHGLPPGVLSVYVEWLTFEHPTVATPEADEEDGVDVIGHASLGGVGTGGTEAGDARKPRRRRRRRRREAAMANNAAIAAGTDIGAAAAATAAIGGATLAGMVGVGGDAAEAAVHDLSTILRVSGLGSYLAGTRVLEADVTGVGTLRTANTTVKVCDPELGWPNVVEAKHRRMVRSHRKEFVERHHKPNSDELRRINAILAHPTTYTLSEEEADVLWVFRYALVQDARALSRFLRCVSWDDQAEVAEALSLLPQWSRPSVEDALQLLTLGNTVVREYAISVLSGAPDAAILMYLLQLVQALRYAEHPAESPLAEFLLSRSVANPVVGNYFVWYLQVELEDLTHGAAFNTLVQRLEERCREAGDTARVDIMVRQRKLVGLLNAVYKRVRSEKLNRRKSIALLKDAVSSDGEFSELASFPPLPLPIDPSRVVTGLIAEKVTMFKSALLPMCLSFRCTTGDPYKVIFKVGDDARQDQLVVQLIRLCDDLLRRENLDLKLSPYHVLATSTNTGIVEVVGDSFNVSQVLKDFKSGILEFFRDCHPDESGPYGVRADLLDTFVKSCAGYCVITYLLAVGDRHLDNLMLTTRGALFHIDFGYICGKDPKPLPPPMKLCKEMIEGMGGADSEHYRRFISYCCESYNILRKKADLILNLMGMMVRANIPDISSQPERALGRVCQNFRLEYTDEEAAIHMQQILNDSVTALAPQLAEHVHRWAQYWRG